MKIEGYYYNLIDRSTDANGSTFRIALLQECDIYTGHFPGHPVCPGVCNIQIVKECAERLVGKSLRIGYIRQCRLITLATPVICPELVVRIKLESVEAGYSIVATIVDAEHIYMEYKGNMIV